jgi:adenylate cyclase
MRRPSRTAALATTAAASIAITLGAMAVGATQPAERLAVDARFDVRGARTPPRDVAVVAIDDRTFDRLQRHYPFPRSLDAQVVRRLTADGVRAVAYDVQFTEQTDDRDDAALFDAFAAAPHPILSTTDTRHGTTNVFGGDDVVAQMGARAAHTAVPTDGDGVVRRMYRSYDGLVGFPIAVAEAVTGRPVGGSPFADDGTIWIDYAGPAKTVPTYSFVDVLQGRVPAAKLRGRIVVVGAGSAELGDQHTTSTSRGEVMMGPEIMANAIDTVLRGFPLRDAPPWVGIALVLLVGCAVPLSAIRLRPVAVSGVAVVLAVALAGATYAAFAAGRVTPFAGPALALLLATLGALLVSAFYAALERERTRTMFARFVDAPVVDELLRRADGAVRLGGVQVDASVLFCDLRRSTALFEALGPQHGIAVLNRFLSEMADAVLHHGGTLIGYRGDGLVALFGAPIAHPDHADRALAAARDMVGPRLATVNAWLVTDGAPVPPLRMGVGIDSGAVLAGNVGSELRMEYTAVGDPANVAARVEELTKAVRRPVLVTAATMGALRVPATDLVPAGAHPIRGRAAPVELWALEVGAD